MDKAEADELFARGLEHQQAGELDEAQAAYERILAALPNYTHVPHLLGVVVSQRGQWYLARRLIESSLLMHANDADALANLGWVLVHLGRHQEAVARCEQAIALNHAHARAFLTRGLALRLLARHEEAVASFEQALRLAPSMVEALNYRGQSLHNLGRFDQALESYEVALQVRPGWADVFNNRGATLTLLQRHPEAAQSFLRAIELQPAFPEALFNHGMGLQAAGRYEEALAHYERALTLRPDYPDALTYRAFALQRLKRMPQDCLASLDRALALRPDYFEALNGRANMLGQLGQFGEALRDYDAAIALRPGHAETHINRGHALRELGRTEDAAAAYREALRLGGDAHSGLFALAALGQEPPPAVAPQSYIVSLFDGYADRFDNHLVGRLKYQAHERVCEAVLRRGPARGDVLDLGCGTGLCAPLLQGVARAMTGVDLSPRMLEVARQRGLYTQLVEADVTAFLQGQAPASFDLVVSTDVFIYIGALDDVFAAVARGLRPGGLFGFSIEASEDADFVLRPTRRYAQSPRYIERLAAAHGFEVLAMEPSVIRQEGGTGIDGFVAVLRAG